jgi:hypothetical protein
MHQLFDSAGESIAHATATERLIMAKDLARIAAKAGRPSAVFEWSYGLDELEAQLSGYLQRYVAAGRRQVAEELGRQEAERRGVALAEKPKPRGKGGGAVGTAAAAGVALGLSLRIRSAMVEHAAAVMRRASLHGAELAAAELEAGIMAAADDAVLRMRAAVHDLVALGRSEEAKANAERIANAVYSSLLDGNSCDECAAMDGRETTDLDEAAGWTPNPSCAGLDRCRCVTVFELEES